MCRKRRTQTDTKLCVMRRVVCPRSCAAPSIRAACSGQLWSHHSDRPQNRAVVGVRFSASNSILYSLMPSLPALRPTTSRSTTLRSMVAATFAATVPGPRPRIHQKNSLQSRAPDRTVPVPRKSTSLAPASCNRLALGTAADDPPSPARVLAGDKCTELLRLPPGICESCTLLSSTSPPRWIPLSASSSNRGSPSKAFSFDPPRDE